MKLARAIAVIICAAAILCIVAALIFLAFMCSSCGYLDRGSTISGPSHWYNYSVENASYVALDISCTTLGQNEINVLRSEDPGNIIMEAIHGEMIMTRSGKEQYDDTLRVGIGSSYASDMYYGGARLNVYLPEGPIYDIKVDTLRCAVHISNFTGTNLVVNNRYSGDLFIEGGDYDYVYADNGGTIAGEFRANKSTLKSGNGRVNIVTAVPG
jgi:hypothetical protein